MKKITVFIMAICFALALAVPCFASTPFVEEQYTYNGVVLPQIPEGIDTAVLVQNADGYHLRAYAISVSKLTDFDGSITYSLIDGEWVKTDKSVYDCTIFWSNKDIVKNGTVLLAGTEPVITLITNAIESSDFIATLEEMAKQLNLQNVVQLLVMAVTAVVGLVFMWWGVRKLTRAVFTAFRKGKISV